MTLSTTFSTNKIIFLIRMFSSPNHIRITFLPIALKVPDKKSPESDMYGSMTHNQNPPSRALQVRILIPMGASG